MVRVSLLAAALVLAALVGMQPGLSGEFNQALTPGDDAPAWSALPGTDDKPHSLADLKEKAAVVVVFTCNSCPVAAEYEDRVIAAAKKYADQGVAFVAINVNRIEDDQLPKMKERAKEKNYPFPYLYDDSQEIGRKYGATFTPEVFVLNKDRKVVYMGGIDDNSDPKAVKTTYLGPAIEAALKGAKPEKAETVAIGCRVRYERKKRTKE